MIRYLSDGSAWVDGIPARDLSAEEWAELTPEQRFHAVASGLYEAEAVIEAIQNAAPIDSTVEVVEPSQPIAETEEAN